ncbi:acyl-CoA dehydrogenase family protein [Enteractinococcus fodinae]|uniref:Glutaryl-CoA dehydrogenase n=1 Tax=Enteractinococcus fodinae TaxID=684663 RepID=A0ABU2AYY2_9MICC|nr:acyl-CoA dehydrogenase family protein [Enteractinococcus fodinae]MDR7345994.1 glutaryl-CoA dehydrogenase [Enteractinococcus fodinae]
MAKSFPGNQEPEYQLTDALDTDYYAVFSDIPEADRKIWQRTRDFAQAHVETMRQGWNDHHYPLEVARAMGQVGLINDGVDHPDLEQFSPLAAGLVNMELSRVDGSLGTILAVQGGLALRTITMFGSEEQQAKYVKAIANVDLPAAFGLTEPDHGSDSTGLETTATRQTDGSYVIRGSKRWIGNGSSGGITITFARVADQGADDDGKVRGFIVPQDAEGYSGTPIRHKGVLRAIDQAHIYYDDVKVGTDALIPGVKSFRNVSEVLYATRIGVAWSALGHATAVFESALSYSTQRRQFGKYLAEHQMIQERLTRMLSDLVSMQLYMVRIAELEAAGTLKPTQAALAKYNNTRVARRIAADARDMLGGNGILLENGVIQHMADIEGIHTYEGTESVQALLVGRDITGHGAFA